uniref:IRS-type PTB domain-containing protein n=1 Tax=Ascaris lumbricoides TaxID=6252 RepID=A0A0M3IDW1_ASCLU
LQLSVDGRYIHYRRGQNVYFSSTLNFDIKRENAIIFVATRNSYFIYANAALLFFMKNAQKKSGNESDITIPESLVENARNAEPRPSERNKYLVENYDADQFHFKESDNESDITIPESLVENARNAEPRPSERNKYLPENCDVDQFHFKGPLIIEHRPQFTSVHELEHDLPREISCNDHIEFDSAMNEAYEIGEGVEKFAEYPKTVQLQKDQN